MRCGGNGSYNEMLSHTVAVQMCIRDRQTLRALPDLIKELLDMGYELVGLSELL